MRSISMLCGAALLFSLAVSLPGQTSGEIAGEVRDPSGSVIAGADVKATNKGTGAERATVTNDSGLYNFPNLQPGVYDVTVSKSGFQTMNRTELTLQVQQVARVDFAMQIGQTSQTVEVTGAAALLTTENATVGSVIENKRIVELPLNGRNFLQLISLSPNVTSGFSDSATASSRAGGSRASQNISVAGQRSEFNHFTLDGVEDTDPTYNTYVFLPSIDALQEFKVQSGIYPAEFGRAISQVNVSTKSGTNAYHGSLFEFLRNDKLDAKNYAFDANRPPKDPFKWNQYGFTLGGPISIPKVFNGKNRLFFFSNYEGYRDRKELRGVFNVPTAAMRTGDFTGFPVIYDPTTRHQVGNQVVASPFPNNKIPLNRLDTKSLQLLEFLPLPNVATLGFTGDRQDGLRRVIDKDQFTQRVDFVESTKSIWYGRYSWGSELQSQEQIQATGSKITTEPRQEMISNNRIFSPTMVNEFRVSHIGFANNFATPLAGIRNVDAELGIPGLLPTNSSAWGIPNVNINTFSTFGDTSNGPFVTNDHIFQFVDNFSWSKGKHALRFGAEIRRDRFNLIGNTDPRGTLTFTGQVTERPFDPTDPTSKQLGYSSGTGTAMADFLLGYQQKISVAPFLAFGQFRGTVQNYYIDDTWRVHPKVTVSIGLRYENTAPYKDKSQNFANLDVPAIVPLGVVNPAQALHPTLVRIGQGDFYQGTTLRFNPAVNVARDGRLGDVGVYPDNNDFAPRLGIAWSPTDKWTVRAGVGIFFVQDIAAIYFDVSRNMAGTAQAVTNNNFPNLTLENPFSSTSNTVSTPSLLGIEPHRRTPYTAQFMFNVQRQINKDTMVEVGYLGAEAHKLQSWFSYNEAAPGATGSPQSKFPFPELATGWVMSGVGKSNYHSLALKVEHRLAHGLTLVSGYTWSKSIDLSSGARAHFGEQQFQQSSYCQECEKGLSIFNIAHRVVTSGLYELPFGKGKQFLSSNKVGNAVLGGWQLSSILTLQSGTPATVISGYDSSNRGTTIDRPDATGAPVALPRGQQDPNRFFNTAAFIRAPTGTLGNVGRNTVIGPGIINWDLSLIKNIAVGEKRQVQFRFEMFNLPNHPNWAFGPTGAGGSNLAVGSSTNLTDPNFGKIRATRTDMRDMQAGLKFIF